ncbi:MAG: isocitrate lyase/phosphoenolpyruvate mutase family protein [Parvularculaceae bacterium]|nr:isocitrate lyase/phosphoenolpyruvate mutase family protein [Parvularculaceae bacterium]
MTKAADFLALHVKGAPFVLANAFDEGSARLLAHLGFPALATSSAAFAMTLGRIDYGVTRAEAVEHGRRVAAATALPVSADLENGYGLSPSDAAMTIRCAAAAGLAGGSIEDSSGDAAKPIIDETLAVERVVAAADAARAAHGGFVLTARAEGLLNGETDLGAIIRRLNAFGAAGADVLFAPGLPSIDAVREVCASVDKPVSVMVSPRFTSASLEDFAKAGVARVSLGPAFFSAAYGALADAAAAIRTSGAFAALAPGYGRYAEIKAAMRG